LRLRALLELFFGRTVITVNMLNLQYF